LERNSTQKQILKEVIFMKKLALALLVLFVGAGSALAAYPDQPITLICPFAAGGGTDAVARILATLMQNDLGVPVNVLNRTGGNGVVGHQAILSAKPDGYTIGIGTVELGMFHWMDLAKFSASDFTPICGVNVDSAAITVPADGWKDYASLMADVKANKGKYTASGTVVGGIWHLAMAAWMVGEGLAADHVRWIPSEGAAPAQQEMVAGGVDMVTCSLAEVSALVEAGRAKVLAYMGDERSPKHPDVPTLKELGIPVSTGTWRGVCGPKDMPEDVLKKLEESLTKAVASQDFIDFMNSRGFGIRFLPSKDWGEFMVNADTLLGVVMKEAGLVQ
jgi:tripartite-type tricarboxylate transporter receptor subunit TctC